MKLTLMSLLKENANRMIVTNDIKMKNESQRLLQQGYKPYRIINDELVPGDKSIRTTINRELVVYFLTDVEYQKLQKIANNIREIKKEMLRKLKLYGDLLPAYTQEIINKEP